VNVSAAWVTAETERQRDETEAARLAGDLGCEVTPHPLYAGVFEVDDALGLIMVSDAPAQIRAEVRRHGLQAWLAVLGRQGRE
jgi:hypothetical protein